jgi:hypothetical protein
MTTRMKPEIPLIPTMPPMPNPAADKAAQRQAMVQLILQRYPGIGTAEATQMLEAMEQARLRTAREQFRNDMAKFAPPAPSPPTYGADGKVVSGIETEPGLRPMPMGAAQPIQPPSQGTPYGQQPTMPQTPPQRLHGGDTGRRLFGAPPSLPPQYGAAMGSASPRQTMDWVDEDGDGIDDRYQAGPGQPRQSQSPPRGAAPGGPRVVPGKR